MTGMTRPALAAYSAKPGITSTCRAYSSSRSAPVTSVARAESFSVPTSIVTSGWALRLWYQSGWDGAPAFEAMITQSSPSGRYTSGVVNGRPLLAPVVVSRIIGAPSKGGPTLPPLARKSSMILWLKSLGVRASLKERSSAFGRLRDGRAGLEHALREGGHGVVEGRFGEGERRDDDSAHAQGCQLLDGSHRVIAHDGGRADGDGDAFGVAPAVRRGLAHDVDQGRQLLGGAAGEEAVAEAAGPLGRGAGVASDHDRHRALGRLRVGRHPLEAGELAREAGSVRSPQGAHRGHVLVGPGAAPLPRDAEGVELLAEPADADADLDPPAREAVERGQLLGQHDRVALGEDEDASRQADPARGRGDVGQPDERIGDRRRGDGRHLAVRAVGIGRGVVVRIDDMLDGPD